MVDVDRLAAELAPALLVGMGAANRGVAAALVRRGHAVTIVDDHLDTDALEALADDLEAIAGERSDLEQLVAGAGFVMPTPGLPEAHAAFALADAATTPVVSELDLAAVWDDRPMVVITGTNGKTTTVDLATHTLNTLGRVAVAAGNHDVPLVNAIDDPSIEVFVVEASSFRLSRATRFRPVASAWLNFADDHLDVHLDISTYEAAKARAFTLVAPDGRVVANADDPIVMRNLPADRHVVTFGADGDFRSVDGELIGPAGPFGKVADLWDTKPTDIANTLAVAALLEPLGVEPADVAHAAATFTAPPHRVMWVGELDGQSYFDDSKATSPAATLPALRAFDKVVLVAGGRNKNLDLSPLANERDRIVGVVAIGEAADEIAAVFEGLTEVRRAFDMDAAVAAARELAAGEAPVLLSPSCTSWDRYANYKERGLDFARAVAAAGGVS